MMQGNLDSLDLLLEYGADLDIADTDGCTGRNFYTGAGPRVVAIVQKWIRKRSGIAEGPLEKKACKSCQKSSE